MEEDIAKYCEPQMEVSLRTIGRLGGFHNNNGGDSNLNNTCPMCIAGCVT